MITPFTYWLSQNHPDKTQGKKRSPTWGQFKREFAVKHPKVCSVCGTKKSLQLHHLVPFSHDPSKEEDVTNVVWLCEGMERNCHRMHGHLSDFRSFNPNALEDIKIWNDKIKNRPPHLS